jgi:mRNA interferase MazF
MVGTWWTTRPDGGSISAAAPLKSTVTTNGEIPRRGEVWWVQVDKKRPAVVVQTDRVRDPRVRSFLVVPLTSRLHLEGLPGNVRLGRSDTGLSKASVANVYDVQKVLKADFDRPVGRLPKEKAAALFRGLKLVLGLD